MRQPQYGCPSQARICNYECSEDISPAKGLIQGQSVRERSKSMRYRTELVKHRGQSVRERTSSMRERSKSMRYRTELVKRRGQSVRERSKSVQQRSEVSKNTRYRWQTCGS